MLNAIAACARLCAVVPAFLAAVATAAVHAGEGPRIHTNEAYLAELQRAAKLDLADPLAVFAAVLGSLPERVTVYPTENYYYFEFLHDGRPFQGNIRLDPTTRDKGKVAFGYFQVLSPWTEDGGIERFAELDASHGVGVERLERFLYRLTFKGKGVDFVLNDLSAVKPPPGVLGADESYLGPIFDESGMRFFLLYNTRLKAFHYVLDETVDVADAFNAAGTARIVIGRRTGFAFYRDHRLERKILIGVFTGNSRVNNWFDGPFDQLPENFIAGEALRDAILAADPTVAGKIDRLGNYTAEDGRYLIHPYMLYKTERDLLRIHACAIAREKRANYHRCFVVGHDGRIDPPPPGRAPKRK